MTFTNLIIYPLMLGLIPAVIGYKKGMSFWGWWLGGAAFFIVALPWVIIANRNDDVLAERNGLKKCPECAEYIKPEAAICHFCHTPSIFKINFDPNIKCPECGADNNGNLAVCGECGSSLP